MRPGLSAGRGSRRRSSSRCVHSSLRAKRSNNHRRHWLRSRLRLLIDGRDVAPSQWPGRRAETLTTESSDIPGWRGLLPPDRDRVRSAAAISSVILPSRSRTWMNFRSTAISSRVRSMPAAEASCASGSSDVRQLVAAGFMPGAQQLDHLVGQFAVVGDGVERLQRRVERFAPRRDFRFVLRHDVRRGRPRRGRASAPPAAARSPMPTSVMKMTPKVTNRIRSR